VDTVVRAREPRLSWLVGVIAAVAAIWLLRSAAIVFVPLAVSFFIAIGVHPVHAYLRRRVPWPRWIPTTVTMALIVAIVGGAMWAMAESVDEAVEAAPKYADRVDQLWRQMDQAARGLGITIPDNLFASGGIQQRLGDVATAAVRTVWEIVSGMVLVFFLVLLMLLEAHVWSENTRRLLRNHRGERTLETIAGIAVKVRQYLYVRTVLGAASAAAAAAWLLALQVDLVLIWVVLTFALNYIPNLGSVIAVFPPALMAALQYGWVWGLVTLGGLALIEQVIGNFVDPRMQGRRLQLSPVIVLVSLVFWTWLWGAVGALLAVPMTVLLLAAASHVPGLHPYTTLAAAEEIADA